MCYFFKNPVLLILILWGQSIAAQPLAEHSGGGRYLKRMEYNILAEGWQGAEGWYNTESKTAEEKLLFCEREKYFETTNG
jgi:hypothetical protein